MSLLAALVRAYDRLPDAPPFGFSSEKIGFCVVLARDGAVAEVVDLRDSDKKRSPRMLMVPQARKRTVGIAPNFLWDKTAYVLGVTAGEGKRTAEEHAKFRAQHSEWLAGTEDPGLLAFLRFLETWTPETFAPPLWPDDLRDQNLVFALADEYRDRFLQDRPAAKALWRQIGAEAASDPQICLVTGEPGPVARLHPSVKGVWGAQSSGASLVSFNLDAFTSYGHEQGDNAPVSEAAVFAYTTALNRYLEKGSGHRIQIGDASTVFWADASDLEDAAEAEVMFAAFFDSAGEDRAATAIVADRLAQIRDGRRLAEIAPRLDKGVRFYVLGLAPNAARLAVRFYWEDDFGALTANYQRFLSDTRLEPPPRDGWPALWRYLRDIAVLGKSENVPPNLAGEWMRAILTGTPYPLTLMTAALMRLRADGDANALRVALLKSVLIRNFKLEVPVALDPANTNKGYALGRLFAVYEEVQRAALGGNVNATIKDKFYGAASAAPQKVFAALNSGSQPHFSKLKKQSPGRAVNLERLLMTITDLMEAGNDPIPASLSSQEQALFGIGYYHQRSDFFRKHDAGATPSTETEE
ncbi:type I-C CRISPR-associated protein Cas8c/Csd1 [Xinfangfangia pollutisoli]|uniref:type I-C CRISPR-associated protein Cas8c/Csd1 n=1 Tax=Xinfangfangia pollutisoli TaxID=2865960 RepID=UPI001CD3184D|nr:type I-C CRISPR-associated protein Cas8c/Csd1 [Xinfangfangia pollutisoli]